MEGEEEEEEEEEDDEDDASVILVRDSRSSGLKPPAVDTTLYGFWPSTNSYCSSLSAKDKFGSIKDMVLSKPGARRYLLKSSGKIFAKIEWKDTSKNPTGSKNNSLSE